MSKSNENTKIIGRYHEGHTWYYVLGNPVLPLKRIRDEAVASGDHGYLKEEIENAALKQEPQRSEALRSIRQRVLRELNEDISQYRRCAFELHRYRDLMGIDPSPSEANIVHTNMALKVSHIFNDFARLALLDSLPEQQLDLFG
ncbi:MAG: hypothetical protein OXR62_16240 [Ahrensia sp.]|nr:hypothetical protein [Ahrensia sp.]